ncbi:MAG: sulfite exporter TauE/SafE family protein [Planctomycetota bacterium]|nr:MAG: sulfite exporter TauE/SafE family protein [Planctomycetota bacterium]
MDPLESVLLFFATLGVGLVSALLGLGGGIFLVPLLLLWQGLPPREAAALGLVCTLATSGAGSVALDRAALADLPVVVTLELSAVVGSSLGAGLLAGLLPAGLVVSLFALVVAWASWRMFGKARRMTPRLASLEIPEYTPQNMGLGMLGTLGAGLASGLLGIGGGPIKVSVMTEVVRLPLKVALANSNLMVGITAATAAAIYYQGGWLRLGLLAPCAAGISLGAYAGGRLAPRANNRLLAFGFSGVLLLLALRLAWKGIELSA